MLIILLAILVEVLIILLQTEFVIGIDKGLNVNKLFWEKIINIIEGAAPEVIELLCKFPPRWDRGVRQAGGA